MPHSTTQKKRLTIKEFLGNFQAPVFSTFITDREVIRGLGKGTRDKVVSEYFLPYEEVATDLKYANESLKADVYFTPNGHFNDASEKRRVKELGKQYDYLLIDTDTDKDTALERVESMCNIFGIKACFIVETGRGYHFYFKFSEPILMAEEGKYIKIHKYLSEMCDADPSIKDVTRLLRVPFYRYWSHDADGEFVSKLIRYEPETKISPVDLHMKVKRALNRKVLDDKARTDEVKARTVLNGKYSNDIFDDIKQLQIEDVVNTLGYSVKQGVIYEGDKYTDGWRVNRFKNYVHNFTETKSNRPEGGPWSFAFKHFGADRDQTFDFFKDKFGVDREKYKKRIQDNPANAPKPIADKKTGEILDGEPEDQEVFVSDSLESSLVLDKVNCRMIVQSIDGHTKQISNFYIIPVSTIVDEDGVKIRLIKLVGKNDTTKSIVFPNESNATLFAKSVRSLGLFNFTGSGKAFNLIIEYINEYVVMRQLYKNSRLGISAQGKFISNNFIMAHKEDEVEVLKLEDQVADDQFVEIKSFQHITQAFVIPKTRPDLQEVIDTACKIYSPRVMLPLILGSITGFCSWHLRRMNYSIPYVFLFGLTQSGKTTISKMVQERILGDRTPRLSAGSTTTLPLQNAMFQNKTTFIGEFRGENKNIKEKISAFLRELYDGSTIERGRSNLTTASYELIGTAVMDGEHIIEDPAAFTRGLYLPCHREMKGDIHFTKKLEVSLQDIYGRLWESGLIDPARDITESFAEIYEEMFDYYSELIDKAGALSGESDRIIGNYALISSVAKVMKLDINKMREEFVATLLNQAARVCRTNARQKMLWSLISMAHAALSAEFRETVTTSKVGDSFCVSIHTLYIETYIKLHKGRDDIALESIVEALHGEVGIRATEGKITIDLEKAGFNNEYCVEMLLSCLHSKKNYGVASQTDHTLMERLAKQLKTISLIPDEA